MRDPRLDIHCSTLQGVLLPGRQVAPYWRLFCRRCLARPCFTARAQQCNAPHALIACLLHSGLTCSVGTPLPHPSWSGEAFRSCEGAARTVARQIHIVRLAAQAIVHILRRLFSNPATVYKLQASRLPPLSPTKFLRCDFQSTNSPFPVVVRRRRQLGYRPHSSPGERRLGQSKQRPYPRPNREAHS